MLHSLEERVFVEGPALERSKLRLGARMGVGEPIQGLRLRRQMTRTQRSEVAKQQQAWALRKL